MTHTMNQLIAVDVARSSHAKTLADAAAAATTNPLGFHPSGADVKKALFESPGFPASSFGLPITDATSVTECKPICGHSLDDMCQFFRVPMPLTGTTGTSQPLHHCDQHQHLDTDATNTYPAVGNDTIVTPDYDHHTVIDSVTTTCAQELVSTHEDQPITVDDSLPRDEVEPSVITSDNVSVHNGPAHDCCDKTSYDASRKKRMVELTKLFQWPSKMINKLATSATSSSKPPTATQNVQSVDPSSDRHAYLQSLQTAMASVSMSTSFSGIDTPATSLMMLAAGLFDELGVDSTELDTQLVLKHTPRNLWACEWFSRSQDELLRHPHQPDHVFSDINSFWLKSIGNRIEALVDKQLINTVLKRLVLTTSTVKATGYCVKCRKDCEVSRFL